jgi:DNA-binding MarR family transcriptional regulator
VTRWQDVEPKRTAAGDVFTELILRVFRLNGLLLSRAEVLTEGTALTAARWQVLGAVLRAPDSVSGIARQMGLTRQSVQRLADALVNDRLAEYLSNPTHRRSKLLRPTPLGLAAIDVIRPRQHRWTNAVTSAFEVAELQRTLDTVDRLIAAVEASDDVS